MKNLWRWVALGLGFEVSAAIANLAIGETGLGLVFAGCSMMSCSHLALAWRAKDGPA